MKDIKEFKVGESFKHNMISPKGYLHLKVTSIETDPHIPWCVVTKHHYEEPAMDEFEEYDRYKKGDKFPFCFDGKYETIN